MNAQQTNIDNTAHNLSNVNTVGFKKARVRVLRWRTAPAVERQFMANGVRGKEEDNLMWAPDYNTIFAEQAAPRW